MIDTTVTHIRMSCCVASLLNQRGLQRPMNKALAALSWLAKSDYIDNLMIPARPPEQPADFGKYIRTFDVPIEHLHRVERTLQCNLITYRKEGTQCRTRAG